MIEISDSNPLPFLSNDQNWTADLLSMSEAFLEESLSEAFLLPSKPATIMSSTHGAAMQPSTMRSSPKYTVNSKRSARLKDEKPLESAHYTPGNWDVLCGRGKTNFEHVGNRRLRVMVANNLNSYVACKNSIEKSKLLRAIVNNIYEASPQGGFLRKANGRWCDIGRASAHEKVGHVFRDSLNSKILQRNSKASKAVKEKSMRESQHALLETVYTQTLPRKELVVEAPATAVHPIATTSSMAIADFDMINLFESV